MPRSIVLSIMKLITERLNAIETFCSSLDISLIGSTTTRGGIYTIAITDEIRIQGNYSSLIVNRIKDAYPTATNEITQNGFVKFKIDAFDCKFEVVLT